jgi:hypothetical protein
MNAAATTTPTTSGGDVGRNSNDSGCTLISELA